MLFILQKEKDGAWQDKCCGKHCGTKKRKIIQQCSYWRQVWVNRKGQIMWHHHSMVSFSDHNAQGGQSGLVDLTLIVLKLAVVWTAKRIFYRQRWTKYGRKEGDTHTKKRKKTPHQSRVLWKIPGFILVLPRPTKTPAETLQALQPRLERKQPA